MTQRTIVAVGCCAALAAALPLGAPAAAEKPGVAGTWVLNRSLSEFPREMGFGMDLVPSAWARSGADSTGRGGSGAAALPTRRESEDDVSRARQLTDEVKNPPAWLRITQTETAVTIQDERGRSRLFSLNGRDDVQQLDGTVAATSASWDGTRLVIRYKVEEDRELRYTLSSKADPPQLIVQVQFVERGGRGSITRIYEPAKAGELESAGHPHDPIHPESHGGGVATWRAGQARPEPTRVREARGARCSDADAVAGSGRGSREASTAGRGTQRHRQAGHRSRGPDLDGGGVRPAP